MPYVALRPYCAADLTALHRLDGACFPPGIAYSRAELRSFLEHPSSFTSLVIAGEEIAGFAIVRPLRRHSRLAPGVRAALHVLTIDVAPAFRRRGMGCVLMRWIIAQAEALRSHSIILEVAVDNVGAQAFYASFGFVVTGTIPGYYNGITDALTLERAAPDLR